MQTASDRVIGLAWTADDLPPVEVISKKKQSRRTHTETSTTAITSTSQSMPSMNEDSVSSDSESECSDKHSTCSEDSCPPRECFRDPDTVRDDLQPSGLDIFDLEVESASRNEARLRLCGDGLRRIPRIRKLPPIPTAPAGRPNAMGTWKLKRRDQYFEAIEAQPDDPASESVEKDDGYSQSSTEEKSFDSKHPVHAPMKPSDPKGRFTRKACLGSSGVEAQGYPGGK